MSRSLKESLFILGGALTLAVAFNNPAWTDEVGAAKTLENQGYTQKNGYSDVKVGGYSLLGCGRGDAYRTEFTAKKDGNTVEGVVCKGLIFKGSTVRTFD